MCAVVGFVLCITDLTHVAPASSVYVHLYVAVLSAAHSYIVVCVVCCDFPKLFIYKPHGMCASARARVKIAVCDSTIAITIHTRLAGAHIAAQHKQKNIYHAFSLPFYALFTADWRITNESSPRARRFTKESFHT